MIPYPNGALTDIAHLLVYAWDLTPEQITNLAKDLPGECADIAARRRLLASVDPSETEPHGTEERA